MLSPRMAYVLLWFPLSSETFVFREIQQLVQRGMDIRVYTMYGEKLRGCSDEMKNYAGPIKRFGSVATACSRPSGAPGNAIARPSRP